MPAHGVTGSSTATANGSVVTLPPTITLAGRAPFRVCVLASAGGPTTVTIPETCSLVA